MINISVMVEVYPEFLEQYRETVLRHANNSLTNEEGCLGFAVHVHENDPHRFFLYESYRSREDIENVHKVAPYMVEFGKTTATWTKSKEIIVWEQVPPIK